MRVTAENIEWARASAQAEVDRMKERRFPILDAPAVPWSIIAPCERQASINHGEQTLERLAERGGLSASEAVAVLECRRWYAMPPEAAKDRLAAIVKERAK